MDKLDIFNSRKKKKDILKFCKRESKKGEISPKTMATLLLPTVSLKSGVLPIRCSGEEEPKSINNNGYSLGVRPPRPRRIILVRHGESEGNVDESAYTRIADPRIGLTEKGMKEAEECGRNIKKMIDGDGVEDWSVYFYVSPYKRTRQTLQHLATSFRRPRIAGMREEPRLREQDFGTSLFFFFFLLTKITESTLLCSPW